MSVSLMSGALSGRGRAVALALGALIVLALIVLGFFRSKDKELPVVAAALAVPEGQAGKAGEVVVTEEAMQLAEINVAPAELRQVQERLMVSGSIKAGSNQLAKITPPAPGKTIELLVSVGDRVRQGQVLAFLDSAELARAQADFKQASARSEALRSALASQRDLAGLGAFGSSELEESRSRAVTAQRDLQEAKRSLAAGQSGVVEAESQLQRARNEVSGAQAELEVKRAHLNRAEALPQLVSLQQMERLRADVRQAEAGLSTARAAVAQGQANLTAARDALKATKNEQPLAAQEAEIRRSAVAREEKVYAGGYSRSRELVEAESAARMAEVELDAAAENVRLLGGFPGRGSKIPLIAPIAGTIQEAGLTLGETVDSEHLAFTVVNLDEVYVELALAPVDLAKVKVGDTVELFADASPEKPFLAELTGIGAATDPVTRTVAARAKVRTPSPLLTVGSFVKATIVTDVRQERLTVPLDALQDHTGRPTLYVAKPDQKGFFEVRHVTLGTEGDEWREVTEGLKPGEPLATHGTFYLKSEAMKSALSDGCCSVGE